MTPRHPPRASSASTFPRRGAFAALLLCGAVVAQAQAPAPVPTPAAEPALAPAALPVGEATRSLLELQRSGRVASSVPRPLSGEVAHRSRERYLKSFEREIPERFQSSVNQRPGSSR